MDNLVLKIGGGEVEDDQFLHAFAERVKAFELPPVIVHGGGKSIAEALNRMGIEFQFVDGLRVTDGDSVRVVEMVLSGFVNKRVVAVLVEAGVRAIGLSGKDLGLLRAEKLYQAGRDLGYVGRITSVNSAALRMLLEGGLVPVISPVSLGEGAITYNVNADHAALAVAKALGAAALVFVTDVPGVMVGGQVVEELAAAEVEKLIAAGIIYGGMIPKVRSALEAVEAGIQRTYITDLAGLERFGRGGPAGTAVVA